MKFEDFKENDYLAFAGAARFANGQPPIKCEVNDDLMFVADGTCVMICFTDEDYESQLYTLYGQYTPEMARLVIAGVAELVKTQAVYPGMRAVLKTLGFQPE